MRCNEYDYKAIEFLTCLRQQQRLTTPPLGSPYALFIFLYGATVDAVELEADWDVKQAANIATACHKSGEEAGERAVTQRIHGFFVCMQKVTDAKRKGEAKAWTQLKTFWMAVVRGLEYLAGHSPGAVVA